MSPEKVVAILAIPAAIGLGIMIYSESVKQSETTRRLAAKYSEGSEYMRQSNWKPPEGFSRSISPDGTPYGTKSFSPDRSDCTGSQGCFGKAFVMSKDCPTQLYTEMAYFNKEGESVGWSNDSSPSVPANQVVKMVYNVYQSSVETGMIATVRCY